MYPLMEYLHKFPTPQLNSFSSSTNTRNLPPENIMFFKSLSRRRFSSETRALPARTAVAPSHGNLQRSKRLSRDVGPSGKDPGLPGFLGEQRRLGIFSLCKPSAASYVRTSSATI